MNLKAFPFLLTLFIAGTLFSDLKAQTITRGPYLQKPTPSSIVIRWRTDSPTDSRVQYGTTSSQSNLVTVDSTAQTTEHEVEITGLSAATTYYYTVGSSSAMLSPYNAAHRFKTFPNPGSEDPIRAWVIGDFGKGNTEQQWVRDSWLNWPGHETADIWLWMGDNAYESGTDSEFQNKVFDFNAGYQNVFSWLPFYPCPGNHDYVSIAPPTSNISPYQHTGPYYDIVNVPTQGEAGGVPSGIEAYYSFDLGNVHFISLNSELGTPLGSANDWIGVYPIVNPFASNFTSSPMTDWLRDDLSNNTKRWTVVYFHQPPFTDGSHVTGDIYEVYMEAMRENIIPILYDYNVDLVLSGHSHVFERSFLVNDHTGTGSSWNPATMLVDGSSGTDSLGEAYVKDLSQTDGNVGTIFVVQGNSGSKTTSPNLSYPIHYYAEGCDSCVGSFILDVHADTLRGRYLKHTGEIGDDFTIRKINGPSGISQEEGPLQSLEAYPNPFENMLSVRFDLKAGAEVKIELMNLSGARLETLFEGNRGAGAQEFEFKLAEKRLADGIYFLRIQAGDQVLVRKLQKTGE